MFKIGSNLSKFRSKNLKANLPSSTRALFSDKARCFSQSGCALYRNFIVTNITELGMENIEDEVHSVKFQGILSLTLR